MKEQIQKLAERFATWVGKDIELTMRNAANWTISYEGKDAGAETRIIDALGGIPAKAEYDEETDLTCIYINLEGSL